MLSLNEYYWNMDTSSGGEEQSSPIVTLLDCVTFPNPITTIEEDE